MISSSCWGSQTTSFRPIRVSLWIVLFAKRDTVMGESDCTALKASIFSFHSTRCPTLRTDRVCHVLGPSATV
ncbi:hypothetical protein BGW80DRAFT_1396244, partial [Lactifluus volemus]